MPTKPKQSWSLVHEHIMNINNSKLFAGLMIITLNIASKFVTFKLGKTAETYLKYTFSRQILVFAMAWMGTRDIYTAIIITFVFAICSNFLFNEQSGFCCLSESFIEKQTGLLEEPPDKPVISEQQIADAVALLASAKKQKENTNAK